MNRIDETTKKLFLQNQNWSKKMTASNESFFEELAHLQTPEYLWIGCSDSRVPANEIIGLKPGEVFVHRNIANLVSHTDLNCLSVLQFSIDVLKVRHIFVVGHYGCGGVAAALKQQKIGLTNLWIHPISAIIKKHHALLQLPDETAQMKALCELNVLEQVYNVATCIPVQEAWTRGQALTIHGWVYGLHDGLMRDTGYCVSNPDEILSGQKKALSKIKSH